MACVKCDFCTPKNSTRAQLLEAKNNLQIPDQAPMQRRLDVQNIAV
jgi:hypothetical protein